MNIGFFKLWAALATAVSLILLGVVIGQHTEKAAATHERAPSERTEVAAVTDPNDPGSVTPAPFTVPSHFTGMKTEWRSAVSNSGDLTGYAILFDPQRREVILEQCTHTGYFDAERNQPAKEMGNFCTSVLWGTLTSLTPTKATAIDRQGQLRELALKLNRDDDRSTLNIEFADHTLKLVHGSRNDLFQLFENTPIIKLQKQQRFAFEQNNVKKQLQARQEAEQRNLTIPQYTLPTPENETRETTQVEASQ